ncbi:MAG: polyketide cyclase, partial [Mycobacterium sp.]|nr:polyketide cyclase [Mycobacterium sp.]
METEHVSTSTTIESSPEDVFAVLADPSAHADIDGTGWVRGSLDRERITAAGQVFRMAMYHPNHPDKDYKIANLVEV